MMQRVTYLILRNIGTGILFTSAIDDETYDRELDRDFQLSGLEMLTGRIRYFSDGFAIGSRKFLKEVYAEFGGDFIRKKDGYLIFTGEIKKKRSLHRFLFHIK